MTTAFAFNYRNSESYSQALQIQKWQGLDFMNSYKVKRAKTWVGFLVLFLFSIIHR
mgnify:CR=1 FL=1